MKKVTCPNCGCPKVDLIVHLKTHTLFSCLNPECPTEVFAKKLEEL